MAFSRCDDPNVEWDVTRSPMARLVGGGVHHGHEGLLSFFRNYHEAWEDIAYEGAELIDAGGENVISVDTQRTRGRASGVETELTQYAGGRSATARLCGWCGSRPARKLSKPPGCRSSAVTWPTNPIPERAPATTPAVPDERISFGVRPHPV